MTDDAHANDIKSEESQAKRIMIVDDEVGYTDIINSTLSSRGYQVTVANDGEEAFEKLKKLVPDLLILDIGLPKINGIALYNKICEIYNQAVVLPFPILIATAREELRDFFESIEQGCFLTKPFELDVLLRKIEKLLLPTKSFSVFLVDSKTNPKTAGIYQSLALQKSAVKLLETREEFQKEAAVAMPDAIVMEYLQNNIAGDAFIREIRETPSFRRIPIIVYSHSGFKGLKEKTLTAGADTYIEHAENYKLLFWTIRSLIHKNRTSAPRKSD